MNLLITRCSCILAEPTKTATTQSQLSSTIVTGYETREPGISTSIGQTKTGINHLKHALHCMVVNHSITRCRMPHSHHASFTPCLIHTTDFQCIMVHVVVKPGHFLNTLSERLAEKKSILPAVAMNWLRTKICFPKCEL